jgi:hypothetical protein
MNRKYHVENQLKSTPDEASTFEEIKLIREKNIADFLAHLGVFKITVSIENEDGSWTLTAADENGNPVLLTVADENGDPI